MKHTKRFACILIVMMLVLTMFGCSSKANEETAEKAEETVTEKAEEADTGEAEEEKKDETEESDTAPDTSVTVTDMMGREVTLAAPAKRIVAVSAADCEIVYALGAGDLLVGRGEWCDYPQEVFNVPSMESGGNTNVEQILALDPDLIVMSSMAQDQEQVKQFEEVGVAVCVSNAANIEETYTSIEMFGKLLGKTEEADTLIKSMKDQFDAIMQNKIEGEKTIYFEVSPLEWGLWAAGGNTFMNEIAEMMGLKNIFADQEGWIEVSEEQVIERNPDYIVTITMYMGEGPKPEEEIMSRKGWENITAVKNAAIFNLPNNELSRPAPRLADGAKLLYDFIVGLDEVKEAA